MECLRQSRGILVVLRRRVDNSRAPTNWAAVLPAVFLALGLLACGGGGGGGGGVSPTAPVAPPVTAVEVLSADIVDSGTVTIISCSGKKCRYSLEIENKGEGCANNVWGVLTLVKKSGRVVETDGWQLDPMTVLRPGKAITLPNECCFSKNSVEQEKIYTSEIFWTDTTC